MADEPRTPRSSTGIEMPRPTAAPLTLAAGLMLLGAGLALSPFLSAVGALLFAVGLTAWIGQLGPGQGHCHEPLAPLDGRPQPIVPNVGAVERLHAGAPGYRLRLPVEVHPVSAGIVGGLVGGLVMPIPALLWGHLSGNGIWYPVNLLAGTVLAGLDEKPILELQQFSLKLMVFGIAIHAITSLAMGLIYGVLLPTLPQIRGGQLVWGGVLMPLLWTGASYGLMGVVNPALQAHVDWPWFIASQFLFGIAAALVVVRSEKVPVPPAGTGSDADGNLR